MRLDSKKENLRKRAVKFMEHAIGKDGLKPDPNKFKAVNDMPKLTCKQEVVSLLGFVNYLSRFLPKMADVAQPFRDLTARNAEFT